MARPERDRRSRARRSRSPRTCRGRSRSPCVDSSRSRPRSRGPAEHARRSTCERSADRARHQAGAAARRRPGRYRCEARTRSSAPARLRTTSAPRAGARRPGGEQRLQDLDGLIVEHGLGHQLVRELPTGDPARHGVVNADGTRRRRHARTSRLARGFAVIARRPCDGRAARQHERFQSVARVALWPGQIFVLSRPRLRRTHARSPSWLLRAPRATRRVPTPPREERTAGARARCGATSASA